MKQGTPLNSAQQEAVLATDGPLLVLAGAGAGKTRVIAERIAHIVEKGTAPDRILAITFTNKAAAEMRERVRSRLAEGGERSVPFVSTFHSLGLTLIKENYRLLGLKKFPSIYDRADSLREIKHALKAIGAEEVEPRMALGAISKMKGEGISAGEYAEKPESPWERQIALAWLRYDEALRKEGAMDFDDLLLRAYQLLRDHKEVAERCRARWEYLHIDEYQDTNLVQARLSDLLVGEGRNICAVGDIDQTIYGWRGAQIANILSFEKKYPGAKLVTLTENYRSSKSILDAANSVIANNVFRREKILETKNPQGAPLSLYLAWDETDEAAFVTRKTRECMEERVEPRDIAVLYRANFQSRALEEQFLAANIPYQVVGVRFFERKEVKDALSFIRAAQGGGGADIARIANVPPRGIGKVTLLKILAGKEGELRGAAQGGVRELRALLARIAARMHELPPSQLVAFVLKESGMERHYKSDPTEGAERLENLRELCAFAARYDALGAPEESVQFFLDAAALASDQDELKEKENRVRLMTVHAAKGLEFSHVFITGLEEGLFPYEREGEAAETQEEERRLMYVALTRAKHKLYLCYASYRTIFGAKMAAQPSKFLKEIPGELLEAEVPERLGKTIYLD